MMVMLGMIFWWSFEKPWNSLANNLDVAFQKLQKSLSNNLEKAFQNNLEIALQIMGGGEL